MKKKAQRRRKKPQPVEGGGKLAKRARRGQTEFAKLTEQRFAQADSLNETLKRHGAF